MFVVSDPDVCGGKPVIKGTRVPVRFIVELLKAGLRPEQVHEQYPHVPLEIIRKIAEELKKGKIVLKVEIR